MNNDKDPISFLYDTRSDDRISSLGKFWKAPPRIEYAKWEPIAEIPIQAKGGVAVEIYETRYPASFYRAVIKEFGIRLDTGSGSEIAELLGEIALAVARGEAAYRQDGLHFFKDKELGKRFRKEQKLEMIVVHSIREEI